MITALTDPNQLPNQMQDQQTFDANMAYVIDMLPERARQENELAAGMSAIAAGGAYAFSYVFDSSIADSDPGLGKLRLGSTTQNAASALRMDVQIVGGTDITNVLADLRACTSAVKGSIRLVKMTDPTRWIIFDVTAVALPSGYRNLTVSARASGGGLASPFSNGDELMVYIDRNGDSGTVPGATELLAEMVVPAGSPVAAFNFPNVFDTNHDWYFVHISTNLSTSINPYVRVAVAGAYVTTASYWYAALTAANTEYRLDIGSTVFAGILQFGDVNSAATSKPILFDGNGGDGSSNKQFNLRGRISGSAAALSGFQIYNGNGAAAMAGTVRVYGVRKV